MTQIEQVYDQLRKVIDPELNINVVDLGLIYDVKLDQGKLEIAMTLTTPGCPLHDSIVNGVKYAVSTVEGVEQVDVELVWSPPWTPDHMTEAGRRALG
ncbi:FeS assembly SUF system protein [Ammoniphilus oxalaticus]|uniref:FeS assembly SUF system protein n=1 Tax=Ammoniphilus oxalaticus TaxID=66863 RepID=A0A419SED9_9BACL|nr:metal-sulfur cluster assembly factor [Ammoniphilus oxalaticus]RKD21706.1 FeS assembly SUF system protein [Ammoniphilus oxalaticus]